MGYNTTYHLTADNTDAIIEICEMDEYPDFEYEMTEKEGMCYCKWYEYDSDMKAWSSKYQDVLFTLTGYGEEDGDIWRAYYRNGKGYRIAQTINFDEFDPEKLK